MEFVKLLNLMNLFFELAKIYTINVRNQSNFEIHMYFMEVFETFFTIIFSVLRCLSAARFRMFCTVF